MMLARSKALSRSGCQRGPCRRPAVVLAATAGGSSHSSSGGSSSGGALTSHQTWLQRQRVLQTEPEHASDADLISLNVGGTLMVTTRSTLRQVKGSMLAILFDHHNAHLLARDGAGRVFLDHDPAAFALILRYLRELRVSGGCQASVLLPSIPPADAAPFRSLVQHFGLQLQITEEAISAAVLRASSAAVVAPGPPGSLWDAAGGTRHPGGSPYASRPASNSAGNPSVPQSRTQQQWWQQQQLRRQQGQQLTRPHLPDSAGDASSDAAGCAPGHGHDMPAGSQAPGAQRASTPPASGHGAGSTAAAPPPHEPQLQHFYLTTSPGAAGGAAAAAQPAPPLRVSLFTEADVAAMADRPSAHPGALAAGFDIVCSTSVAPRVLTFSLVVRSSALLDNVFVGVTSTNHVDQRGLQIPCFGWRQVDGCSSDAPCSAADAGAGAASLQQLQAGDDGCSTDADADADAGAGAQQLWQAGDLVQLSVTLRDTPRLSLKVNGRDVPLDRGGGSRELPSFRRYVWFLALFRSHSEVASIVFQGASISVYAGDHRLTRWL